MFWLTLLAFVIILGLLVFAHEAGHFAMAKIAKVKVEEFAFGFPPKLFSVKYGETKYSINAIPFGGYVKMLGEEAKSDSTKSFGKKKVEFRIAIVIAGVIMNFILAGFLLSIGYMIGMSPIRLDPTSLGGTQTHQVLIAQVNEGSVAQSAGIKVGDMVLGFENVDSFSAYTRANLGQEVGLSIKRSGEVITQEVKISQNADAPLGVGIADVPIVKLGFFNAIYAGFKDMALTTGYIVILLGQFFAGLFHGKSVGGEVAGPIGIFNVTGQALRMGFIYLVQLAALLSINLGLINILPFPALDGGRAIILVAEGIFRRRVIKEEIENLLHTIGFAILILLILIISAKEVIALI
jgi:regulator of sigma E protease